MHVGWKAGIINKVRGLESKYFKSFKKTGETKELSVVCSHGTPSNDARKWMLVRMPPAVSSSDKNNSLGNFYSDGILKYFQFFYFH